MFMASNGDLTIQGSGTGVNWTATSDERLKDVTNEAVTVDPFLVDKLAWAEWTWKKGGQPDQGLIAQRLIEAGLAQHVHGSEDTSYSVDYQKIAVKGLIGLAERVRKLEDRL